MTKPVAQKPKARALKAPADKKDAMPENLHGTEKKNEAIECDIGIRWFDLLCKTVASVDTKDISK